MRKSIDEIRYYFRIVLGELSVEEIMKNRELSIRAELISNLFSKATE